MKILYQKVLTATLRLIIALLHNVSDNKYKYSIEDLKSNMIDTINILKSTKNY